MEFVFVTELDQKAHTTATKVLRKTSRTAAGIVFHTICVFYCVTMLLGVLLVSSDAIFGGETQISLDTILLGMVCPALFLLVIMLPYPFINLIVKLINVFLRRKQVMLETERVTAVFTSEEFTITTNTVKSEYQYSNIVAIAETKDYFVLVLDKTHAVICSKSGISQGTVEGFRGFIEVKTNKEMKKIRG